MQANTCTCGWEGGREGGEGGRERGREGGKERGKEGEDEEGGEREGKGARRTAWEKLEGENKNNEMCWYPPSSSRCLLWSTSSTRVIV